MNEQYKLSLVLQILKNASPPAWRGPLCILTRLPVTERLRSPTTAAVPQTITQLRCHSCIRSEDWCAHGQLLGSAIVIEKQHYTPSLNQLRTTPTTRHHYVISMWVLKSFLSFPENLMLVCNGFYVLKTTHSNSEVSTAALL